MTIFLEIVKDFLDREITKAKDSSTKADDSVINTVSTWLGYGRDVKLSDTKKNYATQLSHDLHTMADQSNDLASFKHLKLLIEKYKNMARQASETKSYNEGAFGPAMCSAIQLTQDIYEKLEKFKLLDIPHDEDPFNEFRYCMAYYYAQKLDDSRTRSILNNPMITSSNELTQKKETLVSDMLIACEQDLQTLDIEHDDYISTRKKRVLACIKTLSLENIDLCKKYTSELAVPFSFNFFSKVNVNVSSIGPGEGFLAYCLQACSAKINAECLVEEKEHALIF